MEQAYGKLYRTLGRPLDNVKSVEAVSAKKQQYESNSMKVSSNLLEAYLKCSTKAWLRSSGTVITDWINVQGNQARKESYATAEIRRLLLTMSETEWLAGPSADHLRAGNKRLFTGVVAQTPNLESHLDAVECLPPERRGRPARLTPIRFVPTNKITKDVKLLLAFDALALSEMLQQEVRLGKIIHGDNHAKINVRTLTLEHPLRQHVTEIGKVLASPSPPSLLLNPHCAECEFRTRCRQKALESDDLSLLPGMTAKERKRLHDKGIFTVTQLSYTFRPRRRKKSMRNKRENYRHALRALAIREKKIHLVGAPEIIIKGTPVYLDVEGLPDRDFYYLVGLRVGQGDSTVQYSLWADRMEDEGKIWHEFISILIQIEDPVLIHYGSYETAFLKRMVGRYGKLPAQSKVAEAVRKSLNLLSVIFAQVYFPTHSNRLKEVGNFLGAKWAGPVTSGAQSTAYRLEWEQTTAPELKTALIAYNGEDCAATAIVTTSLIRIISEANSRTDVEFADRPKKVTSQKGSEIHGSFQSILKAAHFSYERARIKLSKHKRSASPGRKTASKRQPRRSFSAIKGIIVRVPRRRVCPSGHKLSASSKVSQHALLDLRFSKTGCHKTIVRYTGRMGYCKLCHEKYAPPGTRIHRGQRFGWKFQAWVVYQRIALRMSYRLISKATYDLFSEPLAPETAVGFVERFSRYYQRTEDLLRRELLKGQVLHLDETKINIGGSDQYVWIFSDGAHVLFLLRPNRETEFLKPILSNFQGTVVTDFYGGYDALPCAQQKCLVHLIRDMNDDLWKHPFDDELEKFVAAVRNLLVPIIEDVQRFGLKARYLHKHRRRVNRFYQDTILRQAGLPDATARYRKRFERYRDSLFLFIEKDGVPWHNNAAERGLRHLAVQRKISGAFSEKGAQDYLRLLSIAQTCRFQRKSFLGFLLAKSGSVDEYRDHGKVYPNAENLWEKD